MENELNEKIKTILESKALTQMFIAQLEPYPEFAKIRELSIDVLEVMSNEKQI